MGAPWPTCLCQVCVVEGGLLLVADGWEGQGKVLTCLRKRARNRLVSQFAWHRMCGMMQGKKQARAGGWCFLASSRPALRKGEGKTRRSTSGPELNLRGLTVCSTEYTSWKVGARSGLGPCSCPKSRAHCVHNHRQQRRQGQQGMRIPVPNKPILPGLRFEHRRHGGCSKECAP